MSYTETDFAKFGNEHFPAFVGVEVVKVEKNLAIGRMEIKKNHFAPNGYLHAGSIITLADTMAGYGCLYNLPDKGISFTTMELKTNFLGAIKNGAVRAEASLQHAGRTTQIWDVIVKNEETGKVIALFRCTQLILYPDK
jgi:1,4-dihydroxy-2-naphthoyl-CoA hydrolase